MSVYLPEIRLALHLDKRPVTPTVAAVTPAASEETKPELSPKSQQRRQQATPSTVDNNHSVHNVSGSSNVVGNTVNGNGNVVGSNNHVEIVTPHVDTVSATVSQATLTFSFNDLNPIFNSRDFPIRQINVPLIDGAVTVSVVARADGTAPAKNGWLVIMICNECRYKDQPSNMVGLGGLPDDLREKITRERHFDEIYPGTVSGEMRLKIIPPTAPYNREFDIAGRYVCDNCAPDIPSKQQLLRVNVINSE